MNELRSLTPLRDEQFRLPALLTPLLLALALLVPALAHAADPEGQFLQAYGYILQGDSLSSSNLNDKAVQKYQAAQNLLVKLQQKQPNWNASVVSFRLEYVGQQIAALTGGKGAPAARTNGSSSAQGSTGSAGQSGSGVKLLDAGAEPRKVLRLHPKAGAKQSVTMNLELSMAMNVGGMQTPMKLPPMVMPMDITVQEVSPQGDITYQMVMGDMTVEEAPGAMPQVVEAMKQALGGVKGMTSTMKVSNRGITEELEMSVPPGANPQMRQAMDQMKDSLAHLAAPLPEEPVGAGARWEAKMPIKTQGMTINQTATYQLLSMEAEVVKLKSTVSQNAANQKIENPAMPGVKVDLTKMTGNGEGELTLDLSQVAPQAADLQFHSDMNMGVNMGNQKQSMAMKIDVKMTVQSK